MNTTLPLCSEHLNSLQVKGSKMISIAFSTNPKGESLTIEFAFEFEFELAFELKVELDMF